MRNPWQNPKILLMRFFETPCNQDNQNLYFLSVEKNSSLSPLVLRTFVIPYSAVAISCQLLPVMCPNNNCAQIWSAACIVKNNGWLYTLPCAIQFQPKQEIKLLPCVDIMYVQTSGNLCHLNTDPQSSRVYAQLFNDP